MSDAWNDGLEESIEAAIAKEQSPKGVAATSGPEPMSAEQLHPLAGPDSPTMGSPSSGAIGAASQRESGHEEQKGRTKEISRRKTVTYDRQNSGALFKNKLRKTDKHPDYRGHRGRRWCRVLDQRVDQTRPEWKIYESGVPT